jgi:hypothetical protein
VKTTDEQPHLRRGLPERGGSPSGWLQTELAKGNQVHIPLLCSQVRQKRPARLLPGSQQASVARLKSQAPIPSQAGTSCEAGASTARSRDSQPSPSSNSGRRETPGQSRHRFPGGPSTQDNSPIARRASTLNDRSLRGRGQPGSQRESRGRPVSALSRRVKGPPRRLKPQLALGRPHAHTPAPIPQGRHPCQAHTSLVLTLHVVGKAHFYQHVAPNVPGG